jgi:hypothetical protein
MDFCMRHSESRVVRISFSERKRVLVWLFMFEGTNERKEIGAGNAWRSIRFHYAVNSVTYLLHGLSSRAQNHQWSQGHKVYIRATVITQFVDYKTFILIFILCAFRRTLTR